MHKVSVVIPTYNYGSMIGEAIESVLNQTFNDFELIIVDNASTDNTEEIVQQYLADPRIVYHKNLTNLGLVGNWNKCLDLATGELIKFLCADDKFHPLLLERFVEIMDTYPDVALVSSYRKVFGDKSLIITYPFIKYQKGRDIIYNTINTYHWLGEPSSIMFRSTHIQQVGQFDTNKYQFIDLDLWIRLLSVGDCYIIPEDLVSIRSHKAQITSANLKTYRYTFEDYELFKELREGKGYSVDVSDMNIDAAVKQKAIMCAKAMYKMLLKLHKKESRKIFSRAFEIAKEEHVIFSPLVELVRRKTIRKKHVAAKSS